jgi:hemoglobin/transferrin/lactoferrin receptor protein
MLKIVRIRLLAISNLFTAPLLVSAQSATQNSAPLALDEILVTASPGDTLLTAPYSAAIVHAEEFNRVRNVRTLADALDRTPGVMIQRTGYGQASPFLRGFTGFRTLLMIDGIRLNNAVFREGPNQYFATIDPLTVDRIDVVKGPAAVFHGSDAIGGSVNVITRAPRLARAADPNQPRNPIEGEALYRYSSAENSHTSRLRLDLAPSENLAILGGFSRREFGDLRGGRDTGLLLNTGYNEWSGDAKVVFAPDQVNRFTAAFSGLVQDDVPRTHSTTFAKSYAGSTIGSDLRRNLSQDRKLAYLQWESEAPPLALDSAKVSLSFHRQGEEQDRIPSNRTREMTGLRDDQYGLQFSARKKSPLGDLHFGSDWYHDEVSSWGRSWKADGIFNKVLPRGTVARNGSQDQLGAFLEDDIPLTSKIYLTLGGRFAWNRVAATGVDPDPATAPVYPDADQSWSALTGSARIRWEASQTWTVFSGVSQGYRTPNLSDLTAFDIVRSGEREVPQTNLEPEKYLSLELGSKYQSRDGRSSVQGAIFRTLIKDQIIRRPTDVAGIVTRENGGQGYIQGLELQGDFKLTRSMTLFGNACWTEGYVDAFVTNQLSSLSQQSASRIQPLSGLLGIHWESTTGRWWAESTAQLTRRQDRLSPGDRLDSQRIPPGGTKGYQVFGFRAGWRPCRGMDVTAGIENITNLDYRVLGSGVNEPGTNFTLAVRVRF